MNEIKRKHISDSIVTSREVIETLGISRSRLSNLIKTGKLIPIKKNIFLLEDILERKSKQEDLRKKYYRAK